MQPQTTVILDRDDMRRTLQRIAHEIVEKNPEGMLALVGIHRRGAYLAKRLHALTGELLDSPVPLGNVDIAFYRDDLGFRPAAPVVHSTELDFAVDGRTIVIVDDVLYTGRTVRAAIDVIFDFGRPAKVQLATLVDRGHRELPVGVLLDDLVCDPLQRAAHVVTVEHDRGLRVQLLLLPGLTGPG